MLYICGIELTFKRPVSSPATEPPQGGFFMRGNVMNLFIYTDESGVFDKAHEKYYVYGGIIFLGKEQRDECTRKFVHAEKSIRRSGNHKKKAELKASSISNKEKGKLFRSLNRYIKFGVIIEQERVLDKIFEEKKSKQRYLDFAYKIGLKKCLQSLLKEGIILASDINNIHIFVDEHTTATNGKYELREALDQEFKIGTYNFNFSAYYDPILPKMHGIDLTFRNSEFVPLIRAADIIANKSITMQ